MDELGSAVRHSDAPNFQVAPFMYLPDGTLQSAIRFELLLCSPFGSVTGTFIFVLTSVILFLVYFLPFEYFARTYNFVSHIEDCTGQQ